MAIEDFYNETVVVNRLVASDDDDTESYEEHIARLNCHIQPLEDSYAQDIEGNYGKEWLLMCGVVDIQEGDRIVNGTTEYRVTGIESYTVQHVAKHMELRIRLSNS